MGLSVMWDKSRYEGQLLSLHDYWMGRDITFSGLLTPEIRANADDLISRVNGLISCLQLPEWSDRHLVVTSGWRPPSINSAVKNAAGHSYHTLGRAVDILDDKDQHLGKTIQAQYELLAIYGLWMESLDATRGQRTNWVHLDTGERSDRPIRIFKP